jgi:hypothetical protein
MRRISCCLRAWIAAWLLCAGPATPARAQDAAPPSGPVRAPQSRLLLPPGSEVVFDSNQDNPRLPPPPEGAPMRDPGEKVFNLRLAEGRVDRRVSLETVVDLYRREGLLGVDQKPSSLIPLRSGGAPMGSPTGTRSQQLLIWTALFNLPVQRTQLVITVVQVEPQGSTRVRVVQFMGNIQDWRAVQVSNTIVSGLFDRDSSPAAGAGAPPGAGVINPARKPPPLPAGSRPLSAVLHVPQQGFGNLASQLSPAVRIPIEALLQQAKGVSIVQYQVAQPMADALFFQFYQQVARREGWQPVLENNVRAGEPVLIYALPNKQGVFCIHARTVRAAAQVPQRRGPPAFVQGPPITILTVILIEGDIDVGKALPGARGGMPAMPPSGPGELP